MERIFEFNLSDGRCCKLVAKYVCNLVQDTIYADGLNLPGEVRLSTIGSDMVAYVDGKRISSGWDPSYWGLINVKESRAKKIHGLPIGFSSPDVAERYEIWLKELQSAGESNEVKAYNRAKREKAAQEAAQKQAWLDDFNKRKAAAMSLVASVHTEERVISDESGKTTVYIHTITAKSGTVYRYQDRNVFDFGRTINPLYSVDEEHDGGLALTENGILMWYVLGDNGWLASRPLNEEELAAFEVMNYIGHAGHGIRM